MADVNENIEVEADILAEPEEESFFSSVLLALTTIQENAWYILIVAIILYYIWEKKVSQYYNKWIQNKEIQKEDASMKKDSDKYEAQEQLRLAAINKLQEKYKKDAEEYKEKMRQKEEKKREEWLEKQNVDVGRKLNEAEQKKQNEDYNPLMGTGGGRYRAPRRSTCPGGSCGNR